MQPSSAVAQLKSKDGKTGGDIQLVQQDARFVNIRGRIIGLTPGAHGFHVHTNAVTKEGDCESIGPHFNPQNKPHGGKSGWERHVGDLGNVFADSDGVAFFDITDSLIALNNGPNSVMNRTLVVTAQNDDLGEGRDKESVLNGNSGKVLACGTIKFNTSF